MKKRLALGLAVALLPCVAAAQTMPNVPLQRGPVTTLPAGITVQASANVRIAVKTLTFTAYGRGNVDESAVTAAMRAAGITNTSIGSTDGGFGSGDGIVVRGTIDNVTADKLRSAAAAAKNFAAAHPGTTIGNVQFNAPLNACAEHEAPLRMQAFAEARRRAEAIARAAGVGVGAVTGVSEYGGCPPALGNATTGAPVDLATLTAMLGITETVSFAIVVPDAPNRRRTLSGSSWSVSTR